MEQCSVGWHEGKHDPWPFINYILSILKVAYQEFEERVGQIDEPKGAKAKGLDAELCEFLRMKPPAKLIYVSCDLDSLQRDTATAAQRARNLDPSGVRYDADLGRWATSFVMGSINTRVVRRTQALLGSKFDYQEYSSFKKPSAARMASAGSRVFESILGSGIGRRLLRPLLPRPGDGPSQKVMDGGFFETTFIARAKSGAVVRSVLQGQGDPGNRITVKCLCESAFVLAMTDEPNHRSPAGRGGVLTPVTALGDHLMPRLAAAGITFHVAPT